MVCEAVAFLADPGKGCAGDVRGVEESAGPWVAGLPVGGVEGFVFGVDAVVVEVVAVAEDGDAVLSDLVRVAGAHPAQGLVGAVAVEPSER